MTNVFFSCHVSRSGTFCFRPPLNVNTDRCSDSCASVVHSEYHVKRDNLKKTGFLSIDSPEYLSHTHTQAMIRFKFREMGQFKVFTRQPKHCSLGRPCLCFVEQQQESQKNVIVDPTTAYLIQTVFTVRLRVNFHFHHHRIRTSNVAEHFGCVFF